MGSSTRLIVTLLLGMALAACTDDSGALRALKSIGVKDARLTGYRVFGCSEGDLYHTGFQGRAVSGSHVSGVVCGGPLKGSTVRFD